jgi:hypothetical protein
MQQNRPLGQLHGHTCSVGPRVCSVLSFINIVLCSWSHGTVPHCHWHLFFQGLQPPPAASSLQNHRDKIGAHSVMSIQYPSQLKRVKGGHWFRATIHRPTCPSFSCDPCRSPHDRDFASDPLLLTPQSRQSP